MCLVAILTTSTAALLATFKVNAGAKNLPGTLENISEGVKIYCNQTRYAIEEVLVDDAENIQKDLIQAIFNNSKNSLISKLEMLQNIHETSKKNIKDLLSICNEHEACLEVLGSEVDIEKYFEIEMAEIGLFRSKLDGDGEDNPSPLIEKLKIINQDISEKLVGVQSILENLSKTMISNSSSYQGYVQYM